MKISRKQIRQRTNRWRGWKTHKCVPPCEWDAVARTPVPKFGVASVHVVARRRGNIAIVRSGAVGEGAMWGLPGGKVSKNESPLDAAKRELEQEINMFTSTIEQIPFDVTKKRGGHIDVSFAATIDPAEPIPDAILDPDRDVTACAFIDPISDLKETECGFFFRGEPFRYSHWVLLAIERRSRESAK